MKILHNLTSSVLLSLGIAGCSSPLVGNRDITQSEDGSFMIYREDHRGIYGASEGQMKSAAIADAEFFAQTRSMTAIPVSMRSKPVGILGDWATVEYKFRLVDKNDPAARTITVPVDIIPNGHASDLYVELIKLDNLRNKGLLTEAEFNKQKQRLLKQYE